MGRQWWVPHVPDPMLQFIYVSPTAMGSDDDATVEGNAMASDSRHRIGHPVVDVDE